MKKVVTTLLFVLAMVGFLGLSGLPAGAATTSVYCNAAYTNFIGAPGSEGATCSAAVVNPAPTYCNAAYTSFIGAPGSEGATCPTVASTPRNSVGN